MLRETARVGRIGIVTFPNFAHWPNRLSVLRGRMPVTKVLPYQWYDTPNIRVGTFTDFDSAGAEERGCASSTPSACRTARKSASCPMHGRPPPCSSSNAVSPVRRWLLRLISMVRNSRINALPLLRLKWSFRL